jgi:hypothetical protein
MKMRKNIIVLALAVALVGCGKHEARHIVILLDVSGSINRQSLEQAFKAIEDLAGHLHRGDKLTIIPILSDAEAQASGHILRFEMQLNRQAYDADLQHFYRTLATSLKELLVNATMRPGTKTDILGSVALAAQDFATDDVEHVLIILSDFLEEDTETNFTSDIRLSSSNSAIKFSQQIAKRGGLAFCNTRVYLGGLGSDEFKRLDRERRVAIRAFWMSYFVALGSTPEFASDGANSLTSHF